MSGLKAKGPRVSTKVRLPKELHDRLKREADGRDTSVTHLIVRATEVYLRELEREQPFP